jgi:excisionase family DNA binding protein
MKVGIRVATSQEVASFLRMKEATVCRLASEGRLPAVKVGKSWRFDMGRIERLFRGIEKTLKEEV